MMRPRLFVCVVRRGDDGKGSRYVCVFILVAFFFFLSRVFVGIIFFFWVARGEIRRRKWIAEWACG